LGTLLVWVAGLYGFLVFFALSGRYGTTEMVGGAVFSLFIFFSFVTSLGG
jgi:hypothetical protein